MSPIDRPLFGWDAPVRGLLIGAVVLAGSALGWTSPKIEPPLMELPELVVDANAASLPVLEALPGIGPVLSSRIVKARPFGSLADLDRRVQGIGPAKVAGLRPFLRFELPASPPL